MGSVPSEKGVKNSRKKRDAPRHQNADKDKEAIGGSHGGGKKNVGEDLSILLRARRLKKKEVGLPKKGVKKKRPIRQEVKRMRA